MDIELLKQQLDQVYANYPWASEETAEKLATLSTRNSVKATALAIVIQELHGISGAEKLKKTISDTAADMRKSSAANAARVRRTKKYTDRLGAVRGDMSGLDAMTELTAAGAEALSGAAGGLAGLASSFPKVSMALKGTSWLTGGIAAGAGVVAVFSKLISQQEKELRTMIDLGLVMSDQDNYTTLRGTAAQFGMTLADYNGVMQNTSNVLTGIGGAMQYGSGKLLDFLQNPEMVKRMNQFGYAPKQLSMAMADELKQLYELNEVNEFGEIEQNKVVSSFETGNKVGLFLADSLGGRRQELMDSRALIRDNANFKQAMRQNQQYYFDNFGEGAQDNILRFNDVFAMLAGPMLGEELGKELINVMADMANDIQYDDTPINNMSSDLIKKMQMLGPGVLEKFIEMAKLGQTNEIKTEEQTIFAMSQMVDLIRKGPILDGLSPDMLEVSKIRAQAMLLEPEIFEGTIEDIRARLDAINDKVDGADDSIDIVGGLSKAFIEAQNLITPGFGTTGEVMNIMAKSVDGFASVWTSIFGLDNDINNDESKENSLETIKLDTGTIIGGNTTFLPADATKDQKRQAINDSEQRRTDLRAENNVLMRQRNDVRIEIASLDLDGKLSNVERLRSKLEEAKLQPDKDSSNIVNAQNDLNEAEQELKTARTEVQPLQETLAQVEELLQRNVQGQKENTENWGMLITPDATDSEAPDITVPESGSAIDRLLDFIGKGEGSYNSSNRGTINNRIIGSTHTTNRDGKALKDMTFAEIFELQKIKNPNNVDRLFAVGKYQIIPDTMQEIFPHSGLNLSDKFTEENQDILGKLLLVGNNGYAKRPKLAAYLQGDTTVTEHNAMLDFAREWASLPHPSTGNSVYGDGNKSSHSVEEVRQALQRAQAELKTERESAETVVADETVVAKETTSAILIANEVYVPGKPMTENQVSATSMRIAMGNELPAQQLEDYNSGKRILENNSTNTNTDSSTLDSATSIVVEDQTPINSDTIVVEDQTPINSDTQDEVVIENVIVVQATIETLTNRIEQINEEQDQYSTIYPNETNEADINELIMLESQLVEEMKKLQNLERERSDG